MSWSLRLILLAMLVGGAWWQFGQNSPRERLAQLPPTPPGTVMPGGPTGRSGTNAANAPQRVTVEVQRYNNPPGVAPIVARGLDQAAVEAAARGWETLRDGRPEDAVSYFDKAVEGNVPGSTFGLAQVYRQLGRGGEALIMAHQSTAEAPDEPGPWHLLGLLLQEENDLAGAAEAFEKSLAIAPNPELTKALAKLKADLTTREDYFVGESAHFRVRFEGPTMAYLAERILDLLEEGYRTVGLALHSYPTQITETILYTDQAFRDVTRVPGWTRGLYDGTVRLPVSGADQNMAELARVVTHEYVHAAVAHRVGKRTVVPTWLQEGLAMNLEGSDPDKWALGLWQNGGKLIPLKQLSQPFLGLSARQADRAYAQSYLLVKDLLDRNGTYIMGDFLEGLSRGMSWQDAFWDAYHYRPDEMIQRLRQRLEHG